MSPLGPMNGKSFGTSISPWGKSDATSSVSRFKGCLLTS